MMKVLLVHQAFVSPDEAGGTRHFEFARHCVKNGWQFSIVASDFNYLSGAKTGPAGELVSKDTIEEVEILRAYTYPSLHRSFVWRVVSFLSFMGTSVLAGLRPRGVDVVMGTSPPLFQAVSAWLLAKLRRKPFLLEIRDLWPDFAIDLGVLKNPLLIRMSRWLERQLYQRATHLLVNSPAYWDYLVGKGVPPEKISMVANGADAAMFDPDARGEAVRREFGLEGKFVVTYAGALGLANGLPTLLEAASELRAHSLIHFLIVGDGKERSNLEAMAKALGLRNVRFAGTQPKTKMPEILAASDVCVAILKNIPMFRMTYPNKVFDYMAAGRPTLLGIDGVIREVVEAAGGGIFVPPGDAMALAKAIAALEDDRERAWRLGRAAREYVVRHFNRAQQAEEFEALLRRLIAPAGLWATRRVA